MDDIKYHLATAADIDILIELRLAFLESLLGPQPPEAVAVLKEELKQYFHTALSNNTYISWLALAGDKVVGIGGVIISLHPGNFKNPSGWRGHIVNMYTLPEFRKQGICTSILRHLQATAGAMGMTAFELHATKDGEPVYIKDGFHKHTEPTYRKYILLDGKVHE